MDKHTNTSTTVDKKISFLKEKIENEVFITNRTQTIIDGNGGDDEWIFDFRKVTLQPEVLNTYAKIFFQRYHTKIPFQVGGLEVASIPLITAIVMKFMEHGMKVNGFYVRKSRKKKGLLTMVEGVIDEHPIILVDDLISSGGSLMRIVEVLEKEYPDKKITDVVTILRYRNVDTYTYFSERGININSFLEFNDFKSTLGLSNIVVADPVTINPFRVMWGRKETDPHLWKVCTKSGILLSGGYLYYGVDSGHFLCVDEMTGKEVWRYVIPGIGRNTEVFSKPVEHKDSVIFGSQDGNVYALSKQTGERVWTYVDADWVNGSLAISLRHGLVYVGLSYGFLKKRGKVVALEIHNGKVRWEIETKNLISSGVFYSKKKNYIYFSEVDGTVTVVHARNGRVLWSRVVDLDSVTAPILVEKTNEIVVAGLEKERGKISILSADTGVTKITSEIFSFGLVNNPIVFDGVIYISSLDKNLYAIDQKTGKLKMTFFFGSRVFSDPYIFTDKNNKKKLFIGANDARLYEIDMETLRAISITYFTERITDPVVVSDDRSSLYLMTYANEVYKLAL